MEPPNTEFSPLMDNFGYPIVVCVYTVSRCADSGMIQIKSGEKKNTRKKRKTNKTKQKTPLLPTTKKKEKNSSHTYRI